MSEPRQILARWLDQPQPSEPPEGLELAVVEAVYALRPDLAPEPRVSLDDVLDSVTEGPFAASPRVEPGAQVPHADHDDLDAQGDLEDARALADWLDDPDQHPVDEDVAEAIYALRPDLAPAPRVQLDDILGDVTEGPFAQTPAPIVDLGAERRRRGLWIGGATVAALAAATLLFVVPTADRTLSEPSPFVAGQGARVDSPTASAPAAAPAPSAEPAPAAAPAANEPARPLDVDAPASEPIQGDKDLARAEAEPLAQHARDSEATVTREPEDAGALAATGYVEEDRRTSSTLADATAMTGGGGVGSAGMGGSATWGEGEAALGGLVAPSQPAAAPAPPLAKREAKSKKREQSDADMRGNDGSSLDDLLESQEAMPAAAADSFSSAAPAEAIALDEARPTRSRPRKAAAGRAPSASAPATSLDIDQLRSRAWPISPLPVLSDPEAAQAVAASNAAGSASKAISLLLPLLDSPNANIAMTAAFLTARRQYSLGAPDLALATIARGLSRGSGDSTLRSRLLALEGEILEGQGDIDGASRLYRAAASLH